MSNLNLGNVSFAGLKTRVKHDGDKRIGYATVAVHVPQDGSTDEYFAILHHGSTIAEIAENWVYVTNAGYGSSTTRARINAVLSGNDVPLYVAQRSHAQCLFHSDPAQWLTEDENKITDDFSFVVYDHGTGIRTY